MNSTEVYTIESLIEKRKTLVKEKQHTIDQNKIKKDKCL